MIPEDHKTSIITNGLHFMRSITEAYGADEGLKLWDQISSVLDPDVKGQMFLAMITGGYENKITLRGYTDPDRVGLIKALRTVDVRGLGLKDAKDMVDQLAEGRSQIVKVKPDHYYKAITELRRVGFTI